MTIISERKCSTYRTNSSYVRTSILINKYSSIVHFPILPIPRVSFESIARTSRLLLFTPVDYLLSSFVPFAPSSRRVIDDRRAFSRRDKTPRCYKSRAQCIMNIPRILRRPRFVSEWYAGLSRPWKVNIDGRGGKRGGGRGKHARHSNFRTGH